MKKSFIRMLLVVLSFSAIVPQTFAASMTFPAYGTVTPPDEAKVQDALNEFKNLSAKEKKTRIKEAKKALKQLKAEKKASQEPIASKGLQILFAILLPPLGVYLHEGALTNRFWISLLLTLIFYLPGMIYSLIVVLED